MTIIVYSKQIDTCNLPTIIQTPPTGASRPQWGVTVPV